MKIQAKAVAFAEFKQGGIPMAFLQALAYLAGIGVFTLQVINFIENRRKGGQVQAPENS